MYEDLKLTDLMDRDVIVAKPDMELYEVAHIMHFRKRSCMVVIDDERVIGVVSESDMSKFMFGVLDNPELTTTEVREVMSVPPVTIDATDTLYNALVVSRAENIRHLPVIDSQQKLVGMVTQKVLTDVHFHLMEQQTSLLEKMVKVRTMALNKLNKKLTTMSMEDALMEIGNRRAMEADLGHTHSASLRYKRPYSVVLFDVDSFKLYNDHYGHQAGDDVLRRVAQQFRDTIRTCDRVYRYGGEEILLILGDTDTTGAEILASRLVKGLEKLGLEHCKSEFGVVTMSGGIAAPDLSVENSSWQDVVECADRALYEAKQQGRNRVCITELVHEHESHPERRHRNKLR